MPISVTLDSTACWLLNEPADLSDDVTLELRRRYVAEQGRTALEERRTRQSADVAALKFTLTLEGSWGTAFRAVLRTYDMRPLLVPFWQGLGLVSEISSTLWGSGLRVFFEPDWSHYEIRTDGATAPTSFTPSASCCYAPLLWCVFNKLPGDPKALDGETMELQLDLIEAGPAEYALSSTLPIQPLYGPTLSTANGLTPRLILPAAADWSTLPKLGGIDILYERTQIGCVRQPVEKYAPQDPRRRSTLHLSYSPLELARLVALWQWSDGPVNSWWCEAGYSETTLVAATSSASVEIEVADAAPFATESHLCLVDGEGLLIGRKIVSIAGNIITLAESPGDIPAEGARVTPLQMVRFSRDTLKIVWKGDLISIDIEVLEQPHETDASTLAGEVLGGTIGTLPSLWFGYLVTDGTREWRYTSHDRAINCGATLGTFVPKPIEHGDITMELNLERHDFELTVGWWEDCPFFERQTDDAAPVLTVTIYEITAGAESAAKALVTGDVVPKYSADVCSATVRGPEAVLDTKVPVQAISRRCWAPLYGAKCGLSRAALAVPVELVTCVDGVCRFIAARADGIAAAPGAIAGFAGGYAERVFADGRVQRYSIAASGPATSTGSWDASGPWRVGYRSSGAVASLTFSAFSQFSFLARGSSSLSSERGLHLYSSPATPINVYAAKNFTGRLLWGGLYPGQVMCSAHESLVSVVRFVAPSAQRAPVVARAHRADTSGFTGVDICLLHNGVVVAEIAMTSPEPVEIAREVDLAAGDILDVCLGTRGNSWWDTTVVDFSVGSHDFASEWVDAYPYLPVQLSGVLRDVPDGSVPQTGWTLYPGCDKSWSRCQTLGNSDNFRGRPWLPKTNPALVAVSNSTSSGSKK